MPNEQLHWDEIINNLDPAASGYDGWLDKYGLDRLDSGQLIVELGCGWGDDTQYLLKLPARLLSCDFSEEALRLINERYPGVQTVQFDMTASFPFDESCADVVVADLCLHYFDDGEISRIIEEICRTMKPDGRLLCRVNSDKDLNYGAGQGVEVEPGLFVFEGHKKRFFNEELIRSRFAALEIEDLLEYESHKYPMTKVFWEFVGIHPR